MTTEQIMKEFKTVNDKLFAIEKALSDFTENLHNASTKSIGESESTIIDLEIDVADLKNRING